MQYTSTEKLSMVYLTFTFNGTSCFYVQIRQRSTVPTPSQLILPFWRSNSLLLPKQVSSTPHACTCPMAWVCSWLLLSSLPAFLHCPLILKAQFKLHPFHKIFLDCSRVKSYNTFIHQFSLPCRLSPIVCLQIVLKPGGGFNFSATWTHSLTVSRSQEVELLILFYFCILTPEFCFQ